MFGIRNERRPSSFCECKSGCQMNESNTIIAEKSNRLSREEIAAVAYRIWMSEGCPEGMQDVNWHDAERQLLANELSNSVSADSQG